MVESNQNNSQLLFKSTTIDAIQRDLTMPAFLFSFEIEFNPLFNRPSASLTTINHQYLYIEMEIHQKQSLFGNESQPISSINVNK